MRDTRTAPSEVNALAELAAIYGVVPAYQAVDGATRAASPEAILTLLRALGAPIEHHDDAEDALWDTQQGRALAILDPTTVVWMDGDRTVRPRRLRSESGIPLECSLETETGETLEWIEAGDAVVLPRELETGYHALTVGIGGRRSATTRLLVAPRETHDPDRRAWGVFLPLYALRTRHGWGTGDLGDLERLMEWTASLGGRAVGTLPLLASFLSKPFDPSPYSPVSRLFWNELYLDVERAPQLAASPEARALLDDAELLTEIRALHREPLVDYARAYRAKRRVLEALARAFFAGPEWRSDDFWRFLQEHPEAQGYASFRAAGELWGRPWHGWPQRLRQGSLQEGDYPEESARFHLYCQWLARRQLGALALAAKARDVELYLDLPVGAHPDGFDAWRYQELFVPAMTVGAPPDAFFAGGQNWGFPPLHPEKIREDGHRYVVASVRNVCRYAGILRVDHVMSLHRLYWIPSGAPATEGVYVRYPAEELWAILCIESRRWGTAVVGEDLGTVPPVVREAIDRHAARRMYVVPLELREAEPRLEPIPRRSVASLNTQDMPLFAAWWRDADPSTRAAILEALDRAGHPAAAPYDAPPTERARRVMRAALEALAASDARLVLVNLEDLWLEELPQNEPGTTMDERPNWRRKARFSLETFSQLPDVVGALLDIDRLRGPVRE